MTDITKIREAIFRIADPNDSYSQADFDKEFSSIPTGVLSDDLKIKVNFSNKSNNVDPEYATDGASGFDLRANLPEGLVHINHNEYKLIKTGLYFDIPDNMEITIRSRSGLAYKYGVVVLNGIGTIDSDYKGEIGVLLINHGPVPFLISHGDRIAQGVLSTVISKKLTIFNKVNEIQNNTERSTGGYGSTGIK